MVAVLIKNKTEIFQTYLRLVSKNEFKKCVVTDWCQPLELTQIQQQQQFHRLTMELERTL